MKIALFPGSFDPITNGHLDIIRRGLMTVADKVIIGIGINPTKKPLFTVEERIEMIKSEVWDLIYSMRAISRNWPYEKQNVDVMEECVEVMAYEGLTAQFATQIGANFILRGIRDNADLNYELQSSNMNVVVGSVETVFLLTNAQNAFTSSGYIKQVVALGCREMWRLKMLVPERVAQKLLDRIPEPIKSGDILS